ncbi:hypothetical protein IGI37_003539 [Enterococcus sp. AZ194]|uniref:YitT family protein n=1 Tax=Enterococcus sp. AZ194 TaxID=2774629 RepID=UPI003F258B5C
MNQKMLDRNHQNEPIKQTMPIEQVEPTLSEQGLYLGKQRLEETKADGITRSALLKATDVKGRGATAVASVTAELSEPKKKSVLFSLAMLFSLSKIFLGNAVLGFAYAKWMVPHKVINGGVTSLALVLNKWLAIDIPYLTNGLTGLLLIVCLVFLGKESFFKSLVSSFSYLFFFTIFYQMKMDIGINLPIDVLLSCVFISFGYYCCISENSSTVGMDVIALILHKKNPKIPIAATIRNLNFFVLALGFFTYGVESIILGFIFSFGYSWLLAKLLVWHKLGKII